MNNDLISREALKEHKFLTPQVKVIGGRHGGKLKEQIIQAYQKGWNGCIDSIIDNAPTVETTKVEHKAYNEGFKDGVDQGIKLSERQQGEWYYNYQNGWHCSICHEPVKDMPTVMGKADFAFCPNCGADMRGGAE